MSFIVWCRVLPEPRKSGGWWQQSPWARVHRFASQEQADKCVASGTRFTEQFKTNLEYIALREDEWP